MIHAVTKEPGRQRVAFCGPVALSAILGITVDEAERRVNARRGRPAGERVKGVSTLDVCAIIREAGRVVRTLTIEWRYRSVLTDHVFGVRYYGAKVLQIRCYNETLARFLETRDEETRRSTCLVCVTGHFLVVQGGLVCDSTQGLVPVEESSYRRARVRSAHVVEEAMP